MNTYRGAFGDAVVSQTPGDGDHGPGRVHGWGLCPLFALITPTELLRDTCYHVATTFSSWSSGKVQKQDLHGILKHRSNRESVTIFVAATYTEGITAAFEIQRYDMDLETRACVELQTP